jgi:hypothetical protein
LFLRFLCLIPRISAHSVNTYYQTVDTQLWTGINSVPDCKSHHAFQ